jgi:hypothetical protein
MKNRHVATAVLGLTLVLGACGSGASGRATSTGTPGSTAPVVTTVITSVATPGAPKVTVRTDDLDADLQSVDRELNGAQQSVNQANDTSPDRADD